MAKINGTNVAAAIVPFTTDDQFATHEAQYGKGGWREVATIQDRDAISQDRREAGMAVYVLETNGVYILDDDLTTWNQLESGKVDDVKVNGTSVVQNKIANVSVPTKTSEITNDSGFITKSVDDLDNYTKTSDLSSVALTGDYADLENTPTNVSDFTNDADYQNGIQVSNTVASGINTHNTSNNAHSNLLTPITQDIDAIEEKIPAEASSSNQLADKNYVDNKIGDVNEWTTEQYTPTTTNFVVGNTYTVEEAFQRTASLFAGQQGEIDDIEEVIPAQATAQNQLADKNFVNATVATNSANFRGNWATWADVPTDANLYPADYVGSRTPTNNDYMVVSDASDYVPVGDLMHRLVVENLHSTEVFTIRITDENGVSKKYYYQPYSSGFVAIDDYYSLRYAPGNPGYWYIKTNDGRPIIIAGTTYSSGQAQLCTTNDPATPFYVGMPPQAGEYQGCWRFIYVGTWATDGKFGWNPSYQIGTAFTQEQQAAIDSGITANMVDNYVNPNSTANTAYNKRITAVETDKRDIINSANKVYATDTNGANKNDLVYSTSATADTIAQRGTNGVLKVGTPTDNADATTKLYVDTIASDKQDVILDLDTIKSGASLGATALQPGDNISELNNDSGYTTNVGTVTSVNNVQPDANGNVTITIPPSDVTDVQIYGVSKVTSGVANLNVVEQVTSLPLSDVWMGRTVQYVGQDYPSNDIYRGYYYIYETRPYGEHMSRTGWWQLDVQPGGAAVYDGTLTIQKNGTQVGTFTANQSTNSTINITVPTNTGDLTNNSGFITSSDIPVTDVTVGGTSVVTSGVAAVPAIPTVNDSTITLTQGGTTKGTFTLNQSSGSTIDLDAGQEIQVDASTMPDASTCPGRIVQWVGDTSSMTGLTKGYFYISGTHIVYMATITAEDWTPSYTSIIADFFVHKFKDVIGRNPAFDEDLETIYFLYDGSNWDLVDVYFGRTTTINDVTLSEYGVTVTGTPTNGSKLNIVPTVDFVSTWNRLNVQPDNGATVVYDAINEELTIS